MQTHRSEDITIALIVYAILERKVYCVTFAYTLASVIQCSGPREEVAKLVKRRGHDPIRRVERLLDSITVMNVDVDIQHARMVAVRMALGSDESTAGRAIRTVTDRNSSRMPSTMSLM